MDDLGVPPFSETSICHGKNINFETSCSLKKSYIGCKIGLSLAGLHHEEK